MTEGGEMSGDPRWRTEWTALPTREEATQPGTLRIDRDKIPQAIALFAGLRDRMDKLAREARHALRVEPMAADRVSAYAAEMLTAKGLTEPECAYNSIAAFRDQLQGMIDRLEDVQRMTATMEHTNVEGFRRGQGG